MSKAEHRWTIKKNRVMIWKILCKVSFLLIFIIFFSLGATTSWLSLVCSTVEKLTWTLLVHFRFTPAGYRLSRPRKWKSHRLTSSSLTWALLVTCRPARSERIYLQASLHQHISQFLRVGVFCVCSVCLFVFYVSVFQCSPLNAAFFSFFVFLFF